jgi:hypothetical protein
MELSRTRSSQVALMSLEAAAVTARESFACLFSTSEEYEAALITQRRAQGRYDKRGMRWPAILFAGCAAMIVGTVLLLR